MSKKKKMKETYIVVYEESLYGTRYPEVCATKEAAEMFIHTLDNDAGGAVEVYKGVELEIIRGVKIKE